MDITIKKCSNKKHSEINAVIYCMECKRYFCNKCKNSHVDLFEDHHFCNVDQNVNEIFTGYCNENNHNLELEYYCRSHNKLCCAACVTKIAGEGKGQHSNCEISLLKDIKDEKKNKLNENINTLKNLYYNLDESINNLKQLFIKINKSKEELKLNIQNIFTKIRNVINEREEKLLNEVEEKYNKYFVNEDIINKSEKLPKKIKSALEKGKNISSGNNDNLKLNVLINGCINVENSVKEINNIYNTIYRCNSNKDIKIKFSQDNNDINKFMEEIKIFGGIDVGEINIDSKIVSKFDMTKIQNWLKDSFKKINKYELIFRATQHGDSNSILFQKCKNNANLLWIMKNKSNNNILGCFNSIPTNSDGSYSKDMKCFLFSLNKNKKYSPNLQIQNNIYNCSSHVIEFGNGNVYELAIGEKFLSKNTVTFSNGSIFNHKNEISDYNSAISLSELEVFKII